MFRDDARFDLAIQFGDFAILLLEPFTQCGYFVAFQVEIESSIPTRRFAVLIQWIAFLSSIHRRLVHTAVAFQVTQMPIAVKQNYYSYAVAVQLSTTPHPSVVNESVSCDNCLGGRKEQMSEGHVEEKTKHRKATSMTMRMRMTMRMNHPMLIY